MPDKPRLYLIDGHALAYRAYFALTRAADSARWSTKSGEPTAGVYGFTSILLRLLEQASPEYLAVSFDTGRTFRDDLYAEYKAVNAVAVATFADDALDQAIALREEYARKFLDYEDTGAHRAYIGILKRVRLVASVANAASIAASVAANAACRRAAYNRWMTESAHFSDFVRA